MEHFGALKGFGLVMLLAVALETLWRLRTGRGYDRADALATLGVAGGNLIFGVLNGAAIGAVFTAVWAVAPVRWPIADWRTWAVGFLAVEFAYYWFHRFSHEIRWLWASHVVHHSAEQLTLLSAIRLGWTNLLSGGWLVYLPLVLAGFDPRLVLGLLMLNLRYQFFLHTEAVGRLGPLEWILNTPTHHRVHHASNTPYLDRNYGGVLIVFDRLFGTFAAERADEPLRYGLVHPVTSRNPFVLALGEWRSLLRDLRAATSWKRRLALALGKPGASV